MYKVDVLPITKNPIKDTLSYFSSVHAEEGSLISVPIRSKEVPALVINCKSAHEDKAELKELSYSLKKLNETKSKSILRKEFVEAIVKTAYHYATFAGATLSAIIPQSILESSSKVESVQKSETSEKDDEKQIGTDTYKEPYLLQAQDADRFADYKSLIRESFARKKSIFFCVPTTEDTKKAGEKLEKGIEEYTFILDGSLEKKELISTWNKALTTNHPILIIGTGMFLSLPRMDIGTVIIEKESSRAYKTINRPFIDIRIFAEKFAKLIGARLILGDIILRTETTKRFYDHELIEYTPLKWRSLTTAKTALVDMRQYKKDGVAPTTKENGFRIFSDEANDIFRDLKETNSQCFVYCSRRGLSPQVVCNDCATTVTCNRCSSPVVLHEGNEPKNNFFLCHTCGEKRSASEKCKYCTSWNLIKLGIGIETVENELHKNFPDIDIFRIDHDSVKTHKKAKETSDNFYKTPGSILLGTEMAILYLDEQVESSVVASLDSLFAIPDFRGNEKIMNILLKMRQLSRDNFIVQTRSVDEPVFDYAIKGNIADFYRSEIAEREQFAYPPFVTLIKITYQGRREEVLEEMKNLKAFLAPYTVQIFPAFIETVKGKYVMHALIKAEKKTWPDETLVKKLQSLPPHFVVKIDPDNLL
jgi:primosomal protein N' (replication factor Y)